MIDLDRRFDDANQLEVRDLWADIEARRPNRLPEPRQRHRGLAALLAFVVAGAGVAVAIRAFSDHGQPATHRQSPAPSLVTASDLAAAIRHATGECRHPAATFGVPVLGSSQDLQCRIDGSLVVLLSFDPPSNRPSSAPGLRGRAVMFGPSWIVIAPDVRVALHLQAIIGGRIEVSRRSPNIAPQPSPIGAVVPVDSGTGWTLSTQQSDRGLTVRFLADTGKGIILPVGLSALTCDFGAIRIATGSGDHYVWFGVTSSSVVEVQFETAGGTTAQPTISKRTQDFPVESGPDASAFAWVTLELPPGVTLTSLTGLRSDGTSIPPDQCRVP
jgi:hypothetical protein